MILNYKAISQQQLDNVHLAGFRDQLQLPSIYGAADVFILPSIFETWGLAVNEAMNFAKPIVTTDGVGCAVDLVVDGQNGFAIPSADSDVIANRLQQLIDDAALRQRMGAASLSRINEWNYDCFISKFRELLDNLA